MATIRLLYVDTEYRRATYLILDKNVIRFGLAIRRELNNVIDRWAFYVGLADEEYETLIDVVSDHDDISFIGSASTVIGVVRTRTEAFSQQPPNYFIGTHKDQDDLGTHWSSVAVEANLSHFYDRVMEILAP